jgi:hypothetical protein
MQDFFAMRLKEFTLQAKKPGGKMIVNSMTGRTDCLTRVDRHYTPLPAPGMKNSATLGADTRLDQFAFCLVGIMHILLKDAVVPVNLTKTAGCSRIFHIQFSFDFVLCANKAKQQS